MNKTKTVTPKSTFKSLPKTLKVNRPADAKGDIEVLQIDGNEVAQFCLAGEQEKAAKALKGELRPAVLEVALPHIIETNCAAATAKDRVKSVKLMDSTGSVLRVTFKSVYSAVDKEAALAAFDELNELRKQDSQEPVFADLGKYATETLVASFDSKAFLNDSGDFDKPKYDKYREAIEKVAKALGQQCPLTAKDVVVVKDAFDESRWTDFTVDENKRLSEVFTNTIDVVPVDNQHASAHLVDVLTAKVNDESISDEDFRATVRAILAEKTAVLALDLEPLLPSPGLRA